MVIVTPSNHWKSNQLKYSAKINVWYESISRPFCGIIDSFRKKSTLMLMLSMTSILFPYLDEVESEIELLFSPRRGSEIVSLKPSDLKFPNSDGVIRAIATKRPRHDTTIWLYLISHRTIKKQAKLFAVIYLFFGWKRFKGKL